MMTDKTMHKFAEQVEALLGILWLISMAPNATSFLNLTMLLHSSQLLVTS